VQHVHPQTIGQEQKKALACSYSLTDGRGIASSMRKKPLACATRWWGTLAHFLTPPFHLYILLGKKT
jgi:hypothetical protein